MMKRKIMSSGSIKILNLTDDEILKFQRGTPVYLDNICAIYPATLGEIVDEGYSNFERYSSLHQFVS